MLDRAVATPIIEERWGHFLNLLKGLDPTEWNRPTRLPGWAIADLASHVSWGIGMEADSIAKMLAGDETPAAAEAIPASTEPSELTSAIGERLLGLIEVLHRVDDVAAGGVAPMPYGPTPFPFALQVFVMEAAGHTDDLADAVGLDEDIAGDAAAATFIVMGGSLPVLAMASSEEPGDGIGFQLAGPGIDLAVAQRDGDWIVGDPGDQTTRIEGDQTALTRFLLGRIPAADPRLRVEGDHAAMFKRFFPGP
jgi:uncharacterized protein (TIGR03083 family)